MNKSTAPEWMTMEWIEKQIAEHRTLFGQSMLLEVLEEVRRLRLAEDAWISAVANLEAPAEPQSSEVT